MRYENNLAIFWLLPGKCEEIKYIHFFGLIVYIRNKVYKCQYFLMVDIHVIITDQCNQTVHDTKSRERLFIAMLFL